MKTTKHPVLSGAVARDLGSLRDGEIGFDTMVRRNRRSIQGFARAALRHYAGACLPSVLRALDEDDVEQEVQLALWRAVDAWTPDGGATIVAFARHRALSQVSVIVERVLGWPRTTPGRVARGGHVGPVVMTGFEPRTEDGEVVEIVGEPPTPRPSLREGLEVVSFVAPGTTGRDVVEGVLAGYGLADVAAAAFSDPVRREARDWHDPKDAERDIRAAARAIEQALTH